MGFLSFVFSHKLLLIFILAAGALGITTIVLGVENSDLRSQLDEKNTNLVTTPPSTTTTTAPPIDMSKYRLPKSAVPKSYDLYLYPDLTTGLFRGEVTIGVEIQEQTREVVLHSNQLNVSQVLIGEELGAAELDPLFELLIVRKSDGGVFSPGELNVTVKFEGDMKNRIVGLYTSSYVNEEGNSRQIATSKFEPTYARQAYPCFDEPNLKATYKIHLLKPKDENYTALSNYPQTESVTEVSDGILVHFVETVPMSTYLSCFIVSDFKSTDTYFENNGTQTPFRVYASPDQLSKTTYAGEVGQKAIEYYINYFDIAYPLPKLDMVAIPDFVSGAMEHWGLVTYRETALLYEEGVHSASNKQRVAEVVAHELAHSWFGNLVTMDWWNNLWLNEGFATYIAAKGVEAAEPDWEMLEQFQISTLHSILILDATQASHPIIQTVETPDQITEVFDSVSYNKGGSVLRMLESVVTPENFQKGVTNYLKAHAYDNAVTQDLWDEVQKVVGDGINVTEFMDTFTVQMGYPILDVRVEGDSYVLTQKRFLTDYDSVKKRKRSTLNYRWNVPVTYITDSEASSVFWFNHAENNISIPKPSGTRWLKFNPGQVGYYRVNYPAAEWNNLVANVKELSISDRTHLLEESFSIAQSGELSYEVPLALTNYLVDEIEYVPWTVASTQLQTISTYLETSQYYSDFKAYVIDLLNNAYVALTWEDSDANEAHLRKLARVVILNLACWMESSDALQEANERFANWLANTTQPISPDLRTTIYKYGMVNAEETTWAQLFEIFAKETDANEKLKLMNGLANVRKPALLIKLIELAKDETYVRAQDYFTLLQYIAANPVGAPIVWDYVRENWLVLVERFTLNDRYLGRLIPAITSKFSTTTKLEEMQHFFTKYPEAGAGTAARAQALETVSNNIKWLEKFQSVVEAWIVQQQKAA